MNQSRLFLLLLLVALAGAISCPAQDLPKVEVQLLSFPKQRNAQTLELRVAPDATLELSLPSHTLSPVMSLPRLPVWQFGRNVQGADGKAQFKVLGECRPLAARKQVVVGVFMGKGAAAKVHLVPFDSAGFKGGQFLIMNLASQEIGAQIGGKRFRLVPGKHRIVEPAADRGENLCFASLLTLRDEKWRPFFSSNWPIDPASRGFVFVYQLSGRKIPQIHTIVDVLPRGSAGPPLP